MIAMIEEADRKNTEDVSKIERLSGLISTIEQQIAGAQTALTDATVNYTARRGEYVADAAVVEEHSTIVGGLNSAYQTALANYAALQALSTALSVSTVQNRSTLEQTRLDVAEQTALYNQVMADADAIRSRLAFLTATINSRTLQLQSIDTNDLPPLRNAVSSASTILSEANKAVAEAYRQISSIQTEIGAADMAKLSQLAQLQSQLRTAQTGLALQTTIQRRAQRQVDYQKAVIKETSSIARYQSTVYMKQQIADLIDEAALGYSVDTLLIQSTYRGIIQTGGGSVQELQLMYQTLDQVEPTYKADADAATSERQSLQSQVQPVDIVIEEVISTQNAAIQVYIDQYQDLLSQQGTLESEITQSLQQIERVQSQQSTPQQLDDLYVSDINAIMKQLDAYEAQIQALQSQVYSTQTNVDKSQTTLRTLNSEIENTRQLIQDTTIRIQGFEATISSNQLISTQINSTLSVYGTAFTSSADIRRAYSERDTHLNTYKDQISTYNNYLSSFLGYETDELNQTVQLLSVTTMYDTLSKRRLQAETRDETLMRQVSTKRAALLNWQANLANLRLLVENEQLSKRAYSDFKSKYDLQQFYQQTSIKEPETLMTDQWELLKAAVDWTQQDTNNYRSKYMSTGSILTYLNSTRGSVVPMYEQNNQTVVSATIGPALPWAPSTMALAPRTQEFLTGFLLTTTAPVCLPITEVNVAPKDRPAVTDPTTTAAPACGLRGRYIRITKNGSTLDLIQVVAIDGTGKNVAFGKVASSTPTTANVSALTNGTYRATGTTASVRVQASGSTQPSILVDLGSTFDLTAVRLLFGSGYDSTGVTATVLSEGSMATVGSPFTSTVSQPEAIFDLRRPGSTTCPIAVRPTRYVSCGIMARYVFVRPPTNVTTGFVLRQSQIAIVDGKGMNLVAGAAPVTALPAFTGSTTGAPPTIALSMSGMAQTNATLRSFVDGEYYARPEALGGNVSGMGPSDYLVFDLKEEKDITAVIFFNSFVGNPLTESQSQVGLRVELVTEDRLSAYTATVQSNLRKEVLRWEVTGNDPNCKSELTWDRAVYGEAGIKCRYVRVRKPGAGQLAFSQLEVVDKTGRDVALFHPVTAAGVASELVRKRAVQRVRAARPLAQCFATDSTTASNQACTVDLGSLFEVCAVNVYGVTDSATALQGAVLEFLDATNTQVLATKSLRGGQPVEFFDTRYDPEDSTFPSTVTQSLTKFGIFGTFGQRVVIYGPQVSRANIVDATGKDICLVVSGGAASRCSFVWNAAASTTTVDLGRNFEITSVVLEGTGAPRLVQLRDCNDMVLAETTLAAPNPMPPFQRLSGGPVTQYQVADFRKRDPDPSPFASLVPFPIQYGPTGNGILTDYVIVEAKDAATQLKLSQIIVVDANGQNRAFECDVFDSANTSQSICLRAVDGNYEGADGNFSNTLLAYDKYVSKPLADSYSPASNTPVGARPTYVIMPNYFVLILPETTEVNSVVFVAPENQKADAPGTAVSLHRDMTAAGSSQLNIQRVAVQLVSNVASFLNGVDILDFRRDTTASFEQAPIEVIQRQFEVGRCGLFAQYVRIIQPNPSKRIKLSQLIVMDPEGENVAEKCMTYTTAPNKTTSARIVDGDFTNRNLDQSFVTDPGIHWVEVNLGKEHEITNIHFMNVNETPATDDFNSLRIRLYNNKRDMVFSQNVQLLVNSTLGSVKVNNAIDTNQAAKPSPTLGVNIRKAVLDTRSELGLITDDAISRSIRNGEGTRIDKSGSEQTRTRIVKQVTTCPSPSLVIPVSKYVQGPNGGVPTAYVRVFNNGQQIQMSQLMLFNANGDNILFRRQIVAGTSVDIGSDPARPVDGVDGLFHRGRSLDGCYLSKFNSKTPFSSRWSYWQAEVMAREGTQPPIPQEVIGIRYYPPYPNSSQNTGTRIQLLDEDEIILYEMAVPSGSSNSFSDDLRTTKTPELSLLIAPKLDTLPVQNPVAKPFGIATDPTGSVAITYQTGQVIKQVSSANMTALYGSSASTTLSVPTTDLPNGSLSVIHGAVFAGSTLCVAGVNASGGAIVFGGSAVSYPQISVPFGLTVSADGKTLFISDNKFNGYIHKIDAASKSYSGQAYGPFNKPTGVCMDANGAMFVATEGDASVYFIAAGGSGTGVRIAGTGRVAGSTQTRDMDAKGFSLNKPCGLAVSYLYDKTPVIYIADRGTHCVYACSLVDPSTNRYDIKRLAGETVGVSGASETGGSGLTQSMNTPTFLAYHDGLKLLLITEPANDRVRALVLHTASFQRHRGDGQVFTGLADPRGVRVGPGITDQGGTTSKPRNDPRGTTSSRPSGVTGTRPGGFGTDEDLDAAGENTVSASEGIGLEGTDLTIQSIETGKLPVGRGPGSGRTNDLVPTSPTATVITKDVIEIIREQATVTTMFHASGIPTQVDALAASPTRLFYSIGSSMISRTFGGDPQTLYSLGGPISGIAVTEDETVYCVAGSQVYKNGQLAKPFQFSAPHGITVGTRGYIYVAEAGQIRRFNELSAAPELFVGGGSVEPTGTTLDYDLRSIRLGRPRAMARSPDGSQIFFVDGTLNTAFAVNVDTQRITRILGGASATPLLTALASTTPLSSPSTSYQINAPCGITVSASGSVYVSSKTDNLIVRLTPLRQGYTISVVSGLTTSARTGAEAFKRDALALYATLNQPTDLAILSSGTLFAVDLGNKCIRRFNQPKVETLYQGAFGSVPFGPIQRLGNTTSVSNIQWAAGSPQFALSTPLSTDYAVADSKGNLYFFDTAVKPTSLYRLNTAGELTKLIDVTSTAFPERLVSGSTGTAAPAGSTGLTERYTPGPMALYNGTTLFLAENIPERRVLQMDLTTTPPTIQQFVTPLELSAIQTITSLSIHPRGILFITGNEGYANIAYKFIGPTAPGMMTLNGIGSCYAATVDAAQNRLIVLTKAGLNVHRFYYKAARTGAVLTELLVTETPTPISFANEGPFAIRNNPTYPYSMLYNPSDGYVYFSWNNKTIYQVAPIAGAIPAPCFGQEGQQGAPIEGLYGSSTAVQEPRSIAVDGDGSLYVVNGAGTLSTLWKLPRYQIFEADQVYPLVGSGVSKAGGGGLDRQAIYTTFQSVGGICMVNRSIFVCDRAVGAQQGRVVQVDANGYTRSSTIYMGDPADIQVYDDGGTLVYVILDLGSNLTPVRTKLLTFTAGQTGGPKDLATLTGSITSISMDVNGNVLWVDNAATKTIKLWNRVSQAIQTVYTFPTGTTTELRSCARNSLDEIVFAASDGKLRRVTGPTSATVLNTATGTTLPLEGTIASVGFSSNVTSMSFDAEDRLFFCDRDNHCIRMWDPKTGRVSRVVSKSTSGSGLDWLSGSLKRPTAGLLGDGRDADTEAQAVAPTYLWVNQFSNNSNRLLAFSSPQDNRVRCVPIGSPTADTCSVGGMTIRIEPSGTGAPINIQVLVAYDKAGNLLTGPSTSATASNRGPGSAAEAAVFSPSNTTAFTTATGDVDDFWQVKFASTQPISYINLRSASPNSEGMRLLILDPDGRVISSRTVTAEARATGTRPGQTFLFVAPVSYDQCQLPVPLPVQPCGVQGVTHVEIKNTTEFPLSQIIVLDKDGLNRVVKTTGPDSTDGYRGSRVQHVERMTSKRIALTQPSEVVTVLLFGSAEYAERQKLKNCTVTLLNSTTVLAAKQIQSVLEDRPYELFEFSRSITHPCQKQIELLSTFYSNSRLKPIRYVRFRSSDQIFLSSLHQLLCIDYETGRNVAIKTAVSSNRTLASSPTNGVVALSIPVNASTGTSSTTTVQGEQVIEVDLGSEYILEQIVPVFKTTQSIPVSITGYSMYRDGTDVPSSDLTTGLTFPSTTDPTYVAAVRTRYIRIENPKSIFLSASDSTIPARTLEPEFSQFTMKSVKVFDTRGRNVAHGRQVRFSRSKVAASEIPESERAASNVVTQDDLNIVFNSGRGFGDYWELDLGIEVPVWKVEVSVPFAELTRFKQKQVLVSFSRQQGAYRTLDRMDSLQFPTPTNDGYQIITSTTAAYPTLPTSPPRSGTLIRFIQVELVAPIPSTFTCTLHQLIAVDARGLNVAVGKRTWPTTNEVAPTNAAYFVVDGRFREDRGYTLNSTNWFEVDLGMEMDITAIHIYTRAVASTNKLRVTALDRFRRRISSTSTRSIEQTIQPCMLFTQYRTLATAPLQPIPYLTLTSTKTAYIRILQSVASATPLEVSQIVVIDILGRNVELEPFTAKPEITNGPLQPSSSIFHAATSIQVALRLEAYVQSVIVYMKRGSTVQEMNNLTIELYSAAGTRITARTSSASPFEKTVTDILEELTNTYENCNTSYGAGHDNHPTDTTKCLTPCPSMPGRNGAIKNAEPSPNLLKCMEKCDSGFKKYPEAGSSEIRAFVTSGSEHPVREAHGMCVKTCDTTDKDFNYQNCILDCSKYKSPIAERANWRYTEEERPDSSNPANILRKCIPICSSIDDLSFKLNDIQIIMATGYATSLVSAKQTGLKMIDYTLNTTDPMFILTYNSFGLDNAGLPLSRLAIYDKEGQIDYARPRGERFCITPPPPVPPSGRPWVRGAVSKVSYNSGNRFLVPFENVWWHSDYDNGSHSPPYHGTWHNNQGQRGIETIGLGDWGQVPYSPSSKARRLGVVGPLFDSDASWHTVSGTNMRVSADRPLKSRDNYRRAEASRGTIARKPSPTCATGYKSILKPDNTPVCLEIPKQLDTPVNTPFTNYTYNTSVPSTDPTFQKFIYTNTNSIVIVTFI